MFILMLASECAPVAKVGGLGDVVFGLSRELEIRGNSVEIILPKYDCLRYDQIYDLRVTYQDLWVPWYQSSIHCTVYFGFVHGVNAFLSNHIPRTIFSTVDVLWAIRRRSAVRFFLPGVIGVHAENQQAPGHYSLP
jgi:starch synthase